MDVYWPGSKWMLVGAPGAESVAPTKEKENECYGHSCRLTRTHTGRV